MHNLIRQLSSIESDLVKRHPDLQTVYLKNLCRQIKARIIKRNKIWLRECFSLRQFASGPERTILDIGCMAYISID